MGLGTWRISPGLVGYSQGTYNVSEFPGLLEGVGCCFMLQNQTTVSGHRKYLSLLALTSSECCVVEHLHRPARHSFGVRSCRRSSSIDVQTHSM